MIACRSIKWFPTVRCCVTVDRKTRGQKIIGICHPYKPFWLACFLLLYTCTYKCFCVHHCPVVECWGRGTIYRILPMLSLVQKADRWRMYIIQGVSYISRISISAYYYLAIIWSNFLAASGTFQHKVHYYKSFKITDHNYDDSGTDVCQPIYTDPAWCFWFDVGLTLICLRITPPHCHDYGYQVSLVVSGSNSQSDDRGSSPAPTTGGHMRSRVR